MKIFVPIAHATGAAMARTSTAIAAANKGRRLMRDMCGFSMRRFARVAAIERSWLRVVSPSAARSSDQGSATEHLFGEWIDKGRLAELRVERPQPIAAAREARLD